MSKDAKLWRHLRNFERTWNCHGALARLGEFWKGMKLRRNVGIFSTTWNFGETFGTLGGYCRNHNLLISVGFSYSFTIEVLVQWDELSSRVSIQMFYGWFESEAPRAWFLQGIWNREWKPRPERVATPKPELHIFCWKFQYSVTSEVALRLNELSS